MPNELQKFDVTEHIRSRVREVIVSSLPDGHIDAMIKSEYDEFFSRKDRWGNQRQSEFDGIVNKLVRDAIAKRTAAWIDENFEQKWDGDVVTMVGELVADFVPIVQARLAESIVSDALYEIRQRLTQNL
jgi:hypothetical protein